jgi:hypothetical protein
VPYPHVPLDVDFVFFCLSHLNIALPRLDLPTSFVVLAELRRWRGRELVSMRIIHHTILPLGLLKLDLPLAVRVRRVVINPKTALAAKQFAQPERGETTLW